MKKRPVNLNLLTIKQPITAFVSITHRITGVLTVIFVPFFLWGLSRAVASSNSFAQLQALLQNSFIKLMLFLFVSAVLYHLVMGLRHLLMDLGFAENFHAGKKTAWAAIILAAILIIIWGIYIW
jgi:succinate dehydrogenase / fumarate reductase cytochrome b subunit